MARSGHGVRPVWFRTVFAMAEIEDLDAPEQLLTPSEVAALCRVNPKTVTRWARAGKLTAIRTLGGHRRFRVSEIKRCLEEMSAER
jgi:excisionase family DNA binding protein